MENKFKIGDILRFKSSKLLLEVVDVNPQDFKNFYIIKNLETKNTSYKNFDVVHNKCEMASNASRILYGTKTS